MTLDDYLPALKASRDHNVRYLLVPHIFAKYADAPEVLAYYREAFQKEPDIVYFDAATPSVWNEEFLEPLVHGCENGKWHYFSILSRHSDRLRKSPQHVARVSVELLKQHPILKRKVQTIPKKKLEKWALAVGEAAAVPDPDLVELLKPALKDKRKAPINRGAGGWSEDRVCDRAVKAILQILDGESWAAKAFKEAGINGWRTEEEGWETYDRMIENLTVRLKSPSLKR